MKKKFIALILVIPLLLMFTMFNVGEAATIAIDVSVSGITLEYTTEGDIEEKETVNGKILTIDMADHEQKITFATTIKPYNAVAGASYSVAPTGEKGGMAVVNQTTGELELIKTGGVKVTVVATDGLGRYSDSVTVTITSSKPTDLVITGANGVVLDLADAGFYTASARFRHNLTSLLSVYDDLGNQYSFDDLSLGWYWVMNDEIDKEWDEINAPEFDWQSSCPYIQEAEGQWTFTIDARQLKTLYICFALDEGTWNDQPIYRIVRIDRESI